MKLETFETQIGISDHALAAKNIRKELKAAFPHVKFSVRSSSFSMGDSVHISWTDGPCTRDVEKITRKYQEGSFNGMEDIYEYDTTDFHRTHGGSKYVQTSRKISDALHNEIKQALIDRGREPQDAQFDVWRTLSGVNIPHNGKFSGIEIENCQSVARFTVEEKAVSVPQLSDGLLEIVKTKHTQKGFDLWAVRLVKRVSREDFNELRDGAKALGGYWSGYNKDGAIPGFQFREEENAVAFVEASKTGETVAQPEEIKAHNNEKTAEKLEKLADSMDKQIETKMNPGSANQNPTPRRLRMADGMRREGQKLIGAQKLLRGLANAWRENPDSIPSELREVTSKTAAISLFGYPEHGYADAPPRIESVKAFIDGKTDPEALKAGRIKAMEGELLGKKIPGFFLSPPSVAQLVVEYADISENDRVLEPSAGIGSLVEACPNPEKVECLEVNPSLREILTAKGFNLVGRDFLEFDGSGFDRVVMNPPFENGQECEHVLKAFNCLRDGGRLVSVMSNAVTFRTDRKYTEFKAAIDPHLEHMESLPDGSFKGTITNTGVSTVLIVLNK